jgi:predicted nuclease of predicted toxin-antitoxin system
MQTEPWKLFWDHLQLHYYHFSHVGLAPDTLDSIVWQTCQREELVLITDNRNKDDPDSLEATIRSRNTPTSLPVFTIANVSHLRASRHYADRVIDKFFDALLRIEALRGTGRLYLP